MAPEHSSTFEHLAPAADQYALGVVAFELLAGNLPFDAATVPELLGLHALAPVPSIRIADDPRAERLQAAVHRMMAKTVDARFPTCRSAAEALRAALR
jgi:serine/threonine-protein kinase